MVDEARVTPTEHCYIIREEGILSGEPVVKGTCTPVRAIVRLWQSGYAPEEIPGGLPHLSLAAVFDDLSYYCDHREEINEYIVKKQSASRTHPSQREAPMNEELFISIYLDEDVDPVIGETTSAPGFRAVTARDALQLGRPDPEQLAYAVEQGMCSVTHNRGDFEESHRHYIAAGQIMPE